MRFWRKPLFSVEEDSVPSSSLETIARGVLESPFLAASTLQGTFRESRGFAFTFTRAGIPALLARAPFLEAYLSRALDVERARALGRARPPPNAFYLNALLVPAGGRVGRHVDATLGPREAPERCTPRLVSVLYLRTLDVQGGNLALYARDAQVASIAPVPGTFVWFRGDLPHEVEPCAQAAAPDGLRASLVCEQYRLDDDALGALPPVRVHSRAGFAAFLEDARKR